ncbi:P-loop containing nucleoside triphosphate hydrolase protein [Amniculicola lignicola CBS 123094]|uniref:P-loop containing nucleoside triphosphate hydrolase protein n=1 Tax=Amniculicola lignicola CBS 123094 TaxID=1392246 RepID=A0A6A5WRL0_9PLEO|nr:P-loop containing nucleoside triphosphate hydrolase protein [Amniculicola lignicola CBS 123094]
MASSDDFTFIEPEAPLGSKPAKPLFGNYHEFTSGKTTDLDVQIVTALRGKHPELIVTTVPGNNVNLLQFAAAGYAQVELDTENEPVLSWRGFIGPSHRGGSGYLADSTFFARYNYTWGAENFILYVISVGYSRLQYILKEPKGGENPLSHSSAVDALLSTIGAWLIKEVPAIYVYDGYWTRSTKLWEEVKKAKWDDVILDPKMKKALTQVASKFFDSKAIYEEYGVPWKRGLIFHGPVGNGKTISLKALMHTLQERKSPVVTLYVKSAPYPGHIRAVFQMARSMTPCMLVLEDIDTIVTSNTRSYFFNEVDGLENNDGILMVATTNYLERLDPGLSKRPSRFDRKYLFPLPDKGERSLYAQYWRNKLKNKKEIEFPGKLCDAMADITDDFSFAYMKEAFVATLLDLARNHGDDSDDEDAPDGDDDDPLAKYELWRVFKSQVKILRSEMGSETSVDVGSSAASLGLYEGLSIEQEEMVPLLNTMKLQGAHSRAGKAVSLTGAGEPHCGDLGGPFAQNASVFSPMVDFRTLGQSKISRLSDGVWEWGP